MSRLKLSPDIFTTSAHDRAQQRKARDPATCDHAQAWTLFYWNDEDPFYKLPEGHIHFHCWSCPKEYEGSLEGAPDYVQAADKED